MAIAVTLRQQLSSPLVPSLPALLLPLALLQSSSRPPAISAEQLMSFESCEYNTAARGGDKACCSVHRHVQTAAHLSWHWTYPVGPEAAVEPADLLYTPSMRPIATPTNCNHSNYSRRHLHQFRGAHLRTCTHGTRTLFHPSKRLSV